MDPYEVTMSIETIIVQSGYFRGVNINDIALIRTVQPITFNDYVAPVCLPGSRRTFVDVEGEVSGWGATETGRCDLDYLSCDLLVPNVLSLGELHPN
jgi:hypothetical protein